ncbi:Gfo/Idh/MocA family protein [Paenibacillus sp. y28]|uniref:Gfo/Idh/MocA family protein n=1 Tax=Paenibacillus sp. y28 TaxID=3129110 RepID=UPI003018E44E
MEKPFRIVVAGCGNMAKTWVKYALSRTDCEIVGLTDLQEENAAALAKEFGLRCRWYPDVGEAIRKSRANLVFDITVPESHKQIASTAMQMGCDVFTEKPIADSLEVAEELVAIARLLDKRYFVMQNRRYNQGIRALRSFIRSRTIGGAGMVCADFFLGPHFGGFRELMNSPLIVDMAIHTFDQARFITGADPISVYCHEFNPTGSWYKGNASAVCIFEMSDSSVFTYRGSWCALGSPTSWEASWRVTGSIGTAIWDGTSAPYAEIVDPDAVGPLPKQDIRRIEADSFWQGQDGHAGCLDEMFSALRENRPAETDSSDNIKSMRMVFGALESASTGRKVDFFL